ncbi:porin [Arsukibacterium sp.]|uniref:porin n=1 Tax=Arsukibacterium sp. TaxID=1977258 RepID=UPI002FDAD775
MKAIKFSLIAAAVLGSLAVPALANDVKIYGRAHLSVDHLDNGDDAGLNVSSNSSRLGFRASTKLDGGLEAFMQIEQNIRFDEGSGNYASRDSFVGVRGEFGQVRIGQFDTPLKAVRGKVDMFGDRMGDIRNLTRTSTSGSTNANIGNVFDERYRNGVHYRSPKVNNFVFDLHYTPHNNTGATVDNTRESTSMSVSYEVKGFYAAIAYETFEGTNDLDPNAIRIGAYYDISSDLRVSGMYQTASDVPGGDRSVYGLGASYKMGVYTLRGQYYIAADNDQADSGANMLVVGVDRNFGRALTMYAAYGITSNDANAAYRVSAGGRDTQLSTITGETAAGLSLGLVYSF